jgi:hypothetical protein
MSSEPTASEVKILENMKVRAISQERIDFWLKIHFT